MKKINIFNKISKLNFNIITCLVMIIIFSITIFANENINQLNNNNITIENIQNEINIANEKMIQLQYEGFTVVRYNDSLEIIKNLFKLEKSKQQSGINTDFSYIINKIDELKLINENAREADDKLMALKDAIFNSKVSDHLDIIDSLNKTESAFNAERYEESILRTEITYQKISETEATATKLKAFYNASSRNIVNLIKNYWKDYVGYALLLLVVFMIIEPFLSKFALKNKIKNLESRSNTLKELIADTQTEYFVNGNISDSMYHVRVQKYGELLREIYEKIPTLKEELELKKNLKTDLKNRMRKVIHHVKRKR